MKNLFYKSKFFKELRKLARENAAQGKPFSLMNDHVFKGMLSSDEEDSRETLRSLLSACIGRKVSKVQVSHNDIAPAHLDAKAPRLDVHVVFNDGEIADLEMQFGKTSDDLKTRAAVYNADLLAGQAKRGKPYKETKRTYEIFFLNTLLTPASDRFPRRYAYLELVDHDRLTDVSEIIFYELPKLEQKVREILAGRADINSLQNDEKWCIFMRYWHDQRASPLMEKLCREEDFMRAERAVFKVSRDYKKYMRKVFIMRDSMNRASDRLEAREEGEAEGHAKGLAEGQSTEKLAIARKLKTRGQPLAEIAEITDLPIETIENL